jgi:hypothetical protein
MTGTMILLVASASAQSPESDFPWPNSMIGFSVGTPWLVGGRAEAWLADAVSGELGAGTLGEVEDIGFDWAIRWRPDFACLNCGEQVLATFGVGIGGLVVPDLQLEDPWELAVGPDLSVSGIVWVSSRVGFHLTGRAGVGPGWVGTDFSEIEARPWAFLSTGLAF